MKLLLAAGTALSLFLTGILGLSSSTPKTVSSIHAFEESLVPIGNRKAANQDDALIAALQKFTTRKSYEDVSAITDYINAHPQSPWNFSLLANLGTIYQKTGYFSRAIDVWEQAWALGKAEKDIRVQALSNQVAANLATLLSSLGRSERLTSLLAETKGRTIYGAASVTLSNMDQNLWLMKNRPGESFKCGPFALDSIRTFTNKKSAHDPLIVKAQSSSKGFSIIQVRDLSNKLKMGYQIAKRSPGAEFIVPSVVHWKSGHYAALLKKQGDCYLVKDPTFALQSMVSAQALEDESSGYFLVPGGSLPAGWQPVGDTEGGKVWGRGLVPSRAPASKPNDKKCPCGGGSASGGSGGDSSGMAIYRVFAMTTSLSIEDTPVGYSPPVGPDVHFTITYNQLETDQPSTFSFFNFGPQWNCSWLSYVTIPTYSEGTATTAYVNIRGGGQETYCPTTDSPVTDSRGFTNYWATQIQGQITLWVSSDYSTYERRMPDGSKEVFSHPSSSSSPVYMFLTAITDPQNNSVGLQYMTDGSNRLSTITDGSSLALPTTLYYGLASYDPTDPDPRAFLVTEITDPYDRSANFSYYTSAPYQLESSTDVMGIKSTFFYGSGSAVTTMKTPYGCTKFLASTSGTTNILNVTEPDGSQVQAENHIDGSPSTHNYNYEPVPSGGGFISGDSDYWLKYRNTFYWDKKAMEVVSDNPDTNDSSCVDAYIYHFLHTPDGSQEGNVLESEKPAREHRIWYNYSGAEDVIYEGTSANPTVVARVLPNGATQTTQYQYANALNPAAVTEMIDPIGRQTNYQYYPNGIDLETVTQTTVSGTDTTFSATYDSYHRPLSITDAAGQITYYGYNTKEQITSAQPPIRAGHSAETTNYTYTGDFLTLISGPVSGATTHITPDTLGGNTLNRVKSIEDSAGFIKTYSYDNLDRVTQISYPDSSNETFSYVNPTTNAYGVANAVDLDVHSSVDRVGQTTTRFYDQARHLVSLKNPLGNATQYGWCSCGALVSITDANGNVTYINRDLESRVTSKVYPGETQPPSAPDYTYDSVGRVATYTDKRGDVATYSYNADNTVLGISYTGPDSTPTIYYSYDPSYMRVTTAGGASFTYESAGSMGAGKVLTQTNMLTGGSAAVTYSYDEWGRVVNRNIDSANSQTTAFDSLGRMTSVTNSLCPGSTSFGYSYSDPTSRVTQMTYPNGQVTNYSYYSPSFGTTGDERLQEIKNLTSSSTVLSQADYSYYADGKINTWQEQADSNTPLKWTEGYDVANQLTGATLINTGITSPAITANTYGYDAVGNMTSSSVGGVTRGPSYNALNQLTGSTPSGSRTIGVTGLLGASATIKINGTTATVNSGHYFAGTFTMTPGTTATVPVVATDASGNSRTSNYSITAPTELTYTSPTFDADGNMTSNGAGQSYSWDARNELVQITQGSNSYVFAYDALGRCISETDNGTLAKQWVWDRTQMAEERNSSNTVSKRFFAQGEQITVSGTLTPFYYTRDHLGSVREMTDSTGAIQARYDYDPFGRVTRLQGTMASDFQYAGYYEHAASGLNLTFFRAYDTNLAKWLSRDPMGEDGGNNLYGYAANDPIDSCDPLGLCPCHEHVEFYWNEMVSTRDEGLLDDLVSDDFVSGVGVEAKAATIYGSGAAKAIAMKVDPITTVYELGVDVIAIGGAFHCVPDRGYGPATHDGNPDDMYMPGSWNMLNNNGYSYPGDYRHSP